MLSLLRIQNIALIDELEVEFGDGLNLLTGETGSGKSIIVDSLGALIGDRVSADIVKQGADTARIEGEFLLPPSRSSERLMELLDENGLETGSDPLLIRREISTTGRNRIFINGRAATASILRQVGQHLAEIHGQGEHTALYDVANHITILDSFAEADAELASLASAFDTWSSIRLRLTELRRDESEKLQLIDVLRFQVAEISSLAIEPGEDETLEDEKRRLYNVEKLSALSGEAFSLLYDDENSTLATLDRAARAIAELAEYDARFRGFDDQLAAARAVVEELGGQARDFASAIEFSPERLDEIESRLAEISRLKRKYGGSVESVLEHLRSSSERLAAIETSHEHEAALEQELAAAAEAYSSAAARLSAIRQKAAKEFSRGVENELRTVALDKAVFEVRFSATEDFTATGTDAVEFFFSANPGEPVRPLVRVASGGEASRLTLILRSVAGGSAAGRTAVYDEVDVGIGGRVAEAVGRRLKSLSAVQQILCVTHQPQIASLADRHFLVEKSQDKNSTTVSLRELGPADRIDEIARMLAGEEITDAARENARAMLASAK
ncbi:MAG: DNA repair protein RecN [Acidobacteria bacterium]|nr:DNA repair protein RecN [Acidobacteriota bacterium]MCW5948099.1 DNA repair protein RecN [Pyrinomonadaceae bacterium]